MNKDSCSDMYRSFLETGARVRQSEAKLRPESRHTWGGGAAEAQMSM